MAIETLTQQGTHLSPRYRAGFQAWLPLGSGRNPQSTPPRPHALSLRSLGIKATGSIASLGILTSLLLSQTAPAIANPSARNANALVEALRQASAQGLGNPPGVYYSDWQVPAQDIPQWSQQCLGRALTPLQFATSPVTARGILACILNQQIQTGYKASGNNEAMTIRRVAAWWLTRDAARFQDPGIQTYTNRVLALYQQQLVVTPPDPQPPQIPIAAPIPTTPLARNGQPSPTPSSAPSLKPPTPGQPGVTPLNSTASGQPAIATAPTPVRKPIAVIPLGTGQPAVQPAAKPAAQPAAAQPAAAKPTTQASAPPQTTTAVKPPTPALPPASAPIATNTPAPKPATPPVATPPVVQAPAVQAPVVQAPVVQAPVASAPTPTPSTPATPTPVTTPAPTATVAPVAAKPAPAPQPSASTSASTSANASASTSASANPSANASTSASANPSASALKPTSTKPIAAPPATPPAATPAATPPAATPPAAAPAANTPSTAPASPGPTASPNAAPTIVPIPEAQLGASSYDRYIHVGYQAFKQNLDSLAFLHFQRALDERPTDRFALQALKNLEQRHRGDLQMAQISTKAAEQPSESGNWLLITTNPVGDRFLVAPSSVQKVRDGVGYWEFRTFPAPNNAHVPANLTKLVFNTMIYRVVDCKTLNSRVRSMTIYGENRQILLKKDFKPSEGSEALRVGSSSGRVLQYACDKIQSPTKAEAPNPSLISPSLLSPPPTAQSATLIPLPPAFPSTEHQPQSPAQTVAARELKHR